jgi:hypothetical protein
MPRPDPPVETRFAPGQSGNPGGKQGVRKKLETKFLHDLHDAWQTQGPEVIQRLIDEKPEHILKAVAGLLPKHINVDDAGKPDRERLSKLLELVDRRLEELAGGTRSPDPERPQLRETH